MAQLGEIQSPGAASTAAARCAGYSNIKYHCAPKPQRQPAKTADATKNLREKIADLRNEMQITAAGPTTEMGVRMKALADAARRSACRSSS